MTTEEPPTKKQIALLQRKRQAIPATKKEAIKLISHIIRAEREALLGSGWEDDPDGEHEAWHDFDF